MKYTKALRELDRKALKQYYSGVPIDSICHRFGYKKSQIIKLSDDYRNGKLDIFGPLDEKRIQKMFKEESKEMQRLRDRIAELEETLKMSQIKSEGYEIIMRILQEEYGIDLSKKVEAKQSESLRKDIRK